MGYSCDANSRYGCSSAVLATHRGRTCVSRSGPGHTHAPHTICCAAYSRNRMDRSLVPIPRKYLRLSSVSMLSLYAGVAFPTVRAPAEIGESGLRRSSERRGRRYAGELRNFAEVPPQLHPKRNAFAATPLRFAAAALARQQQLVDAVLARQGFDQLAQQRHVVTVIGERPEIRDVECDHHRVLLRYARTA